MHGSLGRDLLLAGGDSREIFYHSRQHCVTPVLLNKQASLTVCNCSNVAKKLSNIIAHISSSAIGTTKTPL